MHRILRVGCLAAWLLPLMISLCPPRTVQAHPLEFDRYPGVHADIDELLRAEGLDSGNTALMLFSTNTRRFLYRLRENTPVSAASNAKLATTFAALRVLTPNYRWKTRFYLVTEKDDTPQSDPAGRSRQGLLVVGGGDPTITAVSLQKVALSLRAKGLRRVDGPLYYDDSLFDRVRYPAAWGTALGGQSWFAPVAPFVVERNTARFLVLVRGNGADIEVLPRPPREFIRVRSNLRIEAGSKAVVRVRQVWNSQGGVFTFQGHVPRGAHTYNVSTAVEEPVTNFFHHLRLELRRLGIEGEMPLRQAPARGLSKELLHTHYSAPLRTLISEVNKESNNLAAELILRSLALTRKSRGVSGEDGLVVLNAQLREDFPDFADQIHFADGSGLSADTKVTASFLVHLLNRVLAHNAFRSEFVSSLSLVGWDGTTRYRAYPEHARGRIRVKTGTLAGVQNLSGYINLERDVVVFAFLVNDTERHFLKVQNSQDRALAGIFSRLLEWEDTQKPAKSGHRRKTQR